MKKKIPRRHRYKKKSNTDYKFTEHQVREIFAEAYGITEQELIEVEKSVSMVWKYTVTGRPFLEVVDDERTTL